METSSAFAQMQQLDLEIARASKRLEELPEKREILTIRNKRKDVLEKQEQVDELAKMVARELTAISDEVGRIDERLAEEQRKLDTGVDHRMVSAITKEMEGLLRRKDKIEFGSKAVLERQAKVAEVAEQVKAALATLDAKEADAIGRFREIGGELQTTIHGLGQERDAIATKINNEMLCAYEEACLAHGGLGVAILEGNHCSVCRVELSPAQRELIIEREGLAHCPSCHRIMVLPE